MLPRPARPSSRAIALSVMLLLAELPLDPPDESLLARSRHEDQGRRGVRRRPPKHDDRRYQAPTRTQAATSRALAAQEPEHSPHIQRLLRQLSALLGVAIAGHAPAMRESLGTTSDTSVAARRGAGSASRRHDVVGPHRFLAPTGRPEGNPLRPRPFIAGLLRPESAWVRPRPWSPGSNRSG